ncbi:hypothetical protein GG804_06260 [Sphingomonas histidinilytica]|jgi:steroid delta-isomerase-like uncharacterized protein|uniref:Ester cyclase n=1 Tax=Rhizorhabdus histidinilytica TaxID=439228 RepID=A0A1T5D060_9SPHN|nr:nuclear transport factor 2 family protein [Rhizorhabdus histidinilytica]MBO9376364.1 hypothetical protein [Rhizorhabdus histidinilytica]QEH79165.1 hypothetical protein EIK56_13790 [Sphingomonas sp. C8-2]SKB64971.1 conserved hypothetical protein, steroid delta-isomerase-related [Rhizorhabdus histidinilytica]
MSDPHNLKLVERVIGAWKTRDSQVFFELFHHDVVYDDVPLGKVMKGHDQFREFYETSIVAFPDIAMTLVAATADAKAGGAEWTLSGTFTGETELLGKPTGKRFEIRGASFLRFEDGKISYLADYWDMVALSTQLGIGG